MRTPNKKNNVRQERFWPATPTHQALLAIQRSLHVYSGGRLALVAKLVT